MVVNQWAEVEDGLMPCGDTRVSLAPGAYEAKRSGWSYVISPIGLGEEIRFVLEDSQSNDIFWEIELFWEKKHLYDKMGLKHQRGILMYGFPGMGKTATAHLVAQDVIEKGGLFFNCEDFQATGWALNNLHIIEPERPVVVLIEDIEQHHEGDITSLLDGVAETKTHVVFMATTNYIDELPDRIKNRPSRFDLRIEIAAPSENVRREYFSKLLNGLPYSAERFEEMVNLSEGLSFAHMKEMLVGAMIYDISPEEMSTRLATLAGETEEEYDDDEDDE